jgi:16S rRNA (guanine527-N7)-methyltransferase
VDLAAPLAALSRLVADWAGRMNLTAHRTAPAVARRLVFEALALAKALPVSEPVSLADLGSGAGFPGLPIALLWPSCRVTLVEARERRHHFQRAAIRNLGLRNATALRGRAEQLEASPHEVVIAQAMAAPARAIAWMLPWAEAGGWLSLPRSADAPAFEPPPGVELASVRTYRVPLSGTRRSLWLARRALQS